MKRQQRILSKILVIILLIQPIAVSAKKVNVTGFKEVKKEKYENDILHHYYHEHSGLEVVWIENKDPNKGFILGVKTPTTDNTGVNHIIEHTVFTGSSKYPSASLFFDANEAYPSTYMNALTSGDMTVFPFITPYEACYKALLPIYLDAIFAPNLLIEPYGFYEESFHYVPQEERCGGVVYNEMKGACSSIDRAIYRGIRQVIFKDSHYAYDSGGDPNEIPKLTYEKCVATYKKYYYPANMKIILYGDLPIEHTLLTISDYVKDQKKTAEGIDLGVHKINEEETGIYAVLPPGSKGCLVKAFVLDEGTSAKTLQDLDLWMTAYLMSSQTSLQAALASQGLQCKWMKDDDVPYPVYALVINDLPFEKMEKCSRMIDLLLEKYHKKELSNAFLEQDMLREMKWYFEKQEESNTRGMNIAQSILDGWAHGREEDQYYMKKQQLAKQTKVDGTIRHVLFEKAKRYTLYFTPQQEQEVDPLSVTTLSNSQWQNTIEAMKKWQNAKYDLEPVALEKLIIGKFDEPKITKKADHWTMETRTDTELVRSQLYINTSHITQKDLKFLFLYSYFLEESAKDISPFSGQISTTCTAYPLKEGYWPCFKLTLTTLPEETEHGVLFNEARLGLLARPESWYKQKLGELVMGMKASSQNNAIGTLASLSMAGADERSAYLYQSHYPLYRYCKEILSMPNMQWINEVKRIDTKLYHKGGLILSTILNKKGENLYLQDFEKVIEEFKQLPNEKGDYALEIPLNDCLVPSDMTVDHSFKCLYNPEGITGEDYVLAAYLTKNYLNPRLRVQLGSYGAGCQVYDLRTIGLYAYRTPDYKKALQVIAESGEYLSKIDGKQLEKCKAEAMSRVHEQYKLLATPIERASAIEQLILWGKSPKEILNLQKDILLTTSPSIYEKQKIYNKLLNEGRYAIMTGKSCTMEKEFTICRY